MSDIVEVLHRWRCGGEYSSSSISSSLIISGLAFIAKACGLGILPGGNGRLHLARFSLWLLGYSQKDGEFLISLTVVMIDSNSINFALAATIDTDDDVNALSKKVGFGCYVTTSNSSTTQSMQVFALK